MVWCVFGFWKIYIVLFCLEFVIVHVYPYVMEKISGLVQSGNRVGLRVYFDGNFWRVDCRFVDDVELKTVTLVICSVCDRWKEEVICLVITLLSCLDPLPSLCSVVVDTHVAVGRSLAHFGPAGKSVVMLFYDVQWLQRSIRQQLRQRIGGLDPYNVLDFLKYRLSSVVNGSAFDRMPLLRQVLSCDLRCCVCIMSNVYGLRLVCVKTQPMIIILGLGCSVVPNFMLHGLKCGYYFLFAVRAQ